MNRRNFVTSSIATGTMAALAPISMLAENGGSAKARPQFYEWRVYEVKDAVQRSLVLNYLEKALIPALNKQGKKHTGVFEELEPKEISKIYVIVTYSSLEEFSELEQRLGKNPSYLEAARSYLQAPADAPAYVRMETSLLKAFAYMPQLAVPVKKDRIFELRCYESATESAGKKKIEMFNEGGEIEIFRRVGLTPVFFGETIIGTKRPNLTYMITFDDMAEHDANWKLFGADPEWKRINALPEYAKTVSNITRTFLKPLAFSEV